MTLAARLSNHIETNGLGQVVYAPCDVILSGENVVQPDVLFVARQRLSIINQAGGVHGAPDLVVEILSPATASRDQVFKRKLYGKYGVREYWVADPASSTIEVLALGASGLDTTRVFPTGAVVVSPLLPDLVLPVDEVFAE